VAAFHNTGTTVVTFLMVFVIQNTQNRETQIMALKLDELLRGVEGARTGFVNLDSMSDDELAHVKSEFARCRRSSRLWSATTLPMSSARSGRAKSE
jgi:low affinity Fe/Cu permease